MPYNNQSGFSNSSINDGKWRFKSMTLYNKILTLNMSKNYHKPLYTFIFVFFKYVNILLVLVTQLISGAVISVYKTERILRKLWLVQVSLGIRTCYSHKQLSIALETKTFCWFIYLWRFNFWWSPNYKKWHCNTQWENHKILFYEKSQP